VVGKSADEVAKGERDKKVWAGRMCKVEHLPSKHEAMSQDPAPTTKK
jgi:hypothetical protein